VPVTVGEPVTVTVPLGVVLGVVVVVGVVCANAVAAKARTAMTVADAATNESALRRNCMGSLSYEWTDGSRGVMDGLLA